MNVRFFCLSAIVSIALIGCSDDNDSPGTTTPADTGVTADTSGASDTGTPADTGTPIMETGLPDVASDTPAALTCAVYCDAVTDNCTGAKNTQYIDKARCLAMCAKMTLGGVGDMSGDTVGCRLNHAKLAKTEGQDAHCPHAGASGGTVCGATRCEVDCKLAIAHCGTKAPFTSQSDCVTKCGLMTFNPAATNGEIDQTKLTLNCVQYHLQAAYQNTGAALDLHCTHLTIASGPCGP